MSEQHSVKKIVIVGGVAAGASAATRARRLSETAQIVMIERGQDVSFANCGMPYHVGGEIADRSKLLVVTPERLRERYALDVRVRTEVTSIDRANKRVRVREVMEGREYDESYDKLILAPGAGPFVPEIPGIDLPGIHTLRNLQDMDRIKQVIDQGAKRALVLGGGFIGLEMIENLVRRNVKATLLEINHQLLGPMDPEMTIPLLRRLKAAEVDVRFGMSVSKFEQVAGGLKVTFGDGNWLETDLVVVGVGVRPENRLAVEAGLAIGPRGGIRVDSAMRTSDPDILAAGDVIEIVDFVTEAPGQVPLAGPANRQGRIAADTALGRETKFRGTQATAIVGFFEKTAAMTGLSEKGARRAGVRHAVAFTHPAHHAGYYPGAEAMAIKLLYDPEDGRVLGAQAVGGAGVDKRIDVIAVAIQSRMTVFDLEEMELCYAPQFGSAKDPVNMIGFVAAGAIRGDHPQRSIAAWLEGQTEDRLLIDVRMPSEFAAGTIPGAINLPVDELRDRLNEIPRSRKLAVFCQVGQRGYLATRILRLSGYDAVNLSGGYKTYDLVAGSRASVSV